MSERSAATGPAALTGTFRSLRNRNYRLFAAGQVVSNVGTWVQRIGQDWLVLQLTHGSGTALGFTTALQFLPLLLFGLWGGMIADRYRKRRVLVVTQSVMGGLALVLGALALTGTAHIWHVYVLAFALGVATAVDNPTRQTFAVEMVGRADLPNAIALNSAIFNLARVVGPAVAGLLIAAAGTGPAFLVNAASFGAALTGLALMRERELHVADPVPRGKGQMREGIRYVRAQPELVLVLALVGFVGAFGMNFQVSTSLITTKVFGVGADGFGLGSTLLAVGALSGALLAARRRRPSRRLVIGAALMFGVFELVAGLMPTYLTFLILLVPTGAALLTFTTAANAMMQLRVSAEMRGRVMGLYMLVFIGTAPIGAPIIGRLADVLGARASLLVGGVVSILAAVAAIVLESRLAGGDATVRTALPAGVRGLARLGAQARASAAGGGPDGSRPGGRRGGPGEERGGRPLRRPDSRVGSRNRVHRDDLSPAVPVSGRPSP